MGAVTLEARGAYGLLYGCTPSVRLESLWRLPECARMQSWQTPQGLFLNGFPVRGVGVDLFHRSGWNEKESLDNWFLRARFFFEIAYCSFLAHSALPRLPLF